MADVFFFSVVFVFPFSLNYLMLFCGFQLILNTFANTLNKTRLRIRAKCVGVMTFKGKIL